MKKTLVIPMLVVMFVLMAATTVFASGNLADEIYTLGQPYGVTSAHKVELERYFSNHPVTADQESYVMSKAREAVSIMDKAGVKDVTKLSESDLKQVQALVKSAATKIGVSVEFTKDGVVINGKDGKSVATLKVTPSTEKTSTTTTISTPATTTSTKKYVYTGANYTVAASVAVALVAVVAVAKLRKNA